MFKIKILTEADMVEVEKNSREIQIMNSNKNILF